MPTTYFQFQTHGVGLNRIDADCWLRLRLSPNHGNHLQSYKLSCIPILHKTENSPSWTSSYSSKKLTRVHITATGGIQVTSPDTLRNHFQMGDVSEKLWWVRRVSLARERCGAQEVRNREYTIRYHWMMGCNLWWLSRIIMQIMRPANMYI